MILNRMTVFQKSLIFSSILLSIVYFISIPFKPYSFDFMFQGASILLIGLAAFLILKNITGIFLGLSLTVAALGEILLSWPNDHYVVYGWMFFLAAHIFAILTCYTILPRPLYLDASQKYLIALFSVVFIASFMIFRPYLNQNKSSILGYMLVLLVLAVMATLPKIKHSTLVLSACLFVVFHFLMGVDQLIRPFFGVDYLSWITYYGAQILLVFAVMINSTGVERRL